MHLRFVRFSEAIILSVFGAASLAAQTPEVIEEIRHDVSPALSTFGAAPVSFGPNRVLPVKPLPVLPAAGEFADPALQTAYGPLIGVTPGLDLNGLGRGFVGPQGTFRVNSAPPDTNASVGATEVIEWVNASLAVFNKTTGSILVGPLPGNALWKGFGGACETNNDGDPVIMWDKVAQRWIFTQFSITGGPPFLQCIAVSTTSTGAGAYHRYAFNLGNFNDYPKLGVWPDAYYISFNMFNAAGTVFLGARACAADRAAMLAGTAAKLVCFQLGSSFGGLLPADLDGAVPPPAGAPNSFVAFGNNVLQLWKFHVDFVTPASSTFTGPTNLAVAAFAPACSGGGTCIPQPATSQLLDSLADRLMFRLAYRNFPSASPAHESLVVNHSVTVGTRVGVRWYEIRNPSTAPVIFQQSTFSPDATFRWMGSIAMDKSGDIALGYSASSKTVFPSIRYTGRLATDPINTLQAEASAWIGSGAQNGGLSRWGDYTSLSIDPVDDCTFWYANEYLSATGSFNWGTRLVSFKFPSCK